MNVEEYAREELRKLPKGLIQVYEQIPDVAWNSQVILKKPLRRLLYMTKPLLSYHFIAAMSLDLDRMIHGFSKEDTP